MPERPNGAVLKTVVRKHPGFESQSLRQDSDRARYRGLVNTTAPVTSLYVIVNSK